MSLVGSVSYLIGVVECGSFNLLRGMRVLVSFEAANLFY